MLVCQPAEGVHGREKVGNPWLRSMCLGIAGVVNQSNSKTKSHISCCVTAKSHIIHNMGTNEHNPISSSLKTHTFAELDLLQISHTPMINITMTELYKAFIFVMHVI